MPPNTDSLPKYRGVDTSSVAAYRASLMANYGDAQGTRLFAATIIDNPGLDADRFSHGTRGLFGMSYERWQETVADLNSNKDLNIYGYTPQQLKNNWAGLSKDPNVAAYVANHAMNMAKADLVERVNTTTGSNHTKATDLTNWRQEELDMYLLADMGRRYSSPAHKEAILSGLDKKGRFDMTSMIKSMDKLTTEARKKQFIMDADKPGQNIQPKVKQDMTRPIHYAMAANNILVQHGVEGHKDFVMPSPEELQLIRKMEDLAPIPGTRGESHTPTGSGTRQRVINEREYLYHRGNEAIAANQLSSIGKKFNDWQTRMVEQDVSLSTDPDALPTREEGQAVKLAKSTIEQTPGKLAALDALEVEHERNRAVVLQQTGADDAWMRSLDTDVRSDNPGPVVPTNNYVAKKLNNETDPAERQRLQQEFDGRYEDLTPWETAKQIGSDLANIPSALRDVVENEDVGLQAGVDSAVDAARNVGDLLGNSDPEAPDQQGRPEQYRGLGLVDSVKQAGSEIANIPTAIKEVGAAAVDGVAESGIGDRFSELGLDALEGIRGVRERALAEAEASPDGEFNLFSRDGLGVAGDLATSAIRGVGRVFGDAVDAVQGNAEAQQLTNESELQARNNQIRESILADTSDNADRMRSLRSRIDVAGAAGDIATVDALNTELQEIQAQDDVLREAFISLDPITFDGYGSRSDVTEVDLTQSAQPSPTVTNNPANILKDGDGDGVVDDENGGRPPYRGPLRDPQVPDPAQQATPITSITPTPATQAPRVQRTRPSGAGTTTAVADEVSPVGFKARKNLFDARLANETIAQGNLDAMDRMRTIEQVRGDPNGQRNALGFLLADDGGDTENSVFEFAFKQPEASIRSNLSHVLRLSKRKQDPGTQAANLAAQADRVGAYQNALTEDLVGATAAELSQISKDLTDAVTSELQLEDEDYAGVYG